MSIKLMNLVFKNRELKGNTRMTLLAMADNASDEGYCWPSYDTIARKVNITRRSAMRTIDNLIDKGYIHKTYRYKEGSGELTSNSYQLVEGVMVSATLEVVTPLSPPGVASVTTVVTEESPKPPIEPSYNQFEEEEATTELTKLYQNNIGMVTPIVAEWIKDAVDTYPSDWFRPAVEEAVKNNARKWNYVLAILESWSTNGFQHDSRPQKGGKGRDYDKAAEEWLQMREEVKSAGS